MAKKPRLIRTFTELDELFELVEVTHMMFGKFKELISQQSPGLVSEASDERQSYNTALSGYCACEAASEMKVDPLIQTAYAACSDYLDTYASMVALLQLAE